MFLFAGYGHICYACSMQQYLTNPLSFSQAKKNQPTHLVGWLGVDEAGRGCLAGPVVAGAVWLPAKCTLPGLTDSKKLTPQQRAELEEKIKTQALAWSLGFVWPKEIDQYNILQATFMAMSRAVASLHLGSFYSVESWDKANNPNHIQGLLIDGNFIIPHSHLNEGLDKWGNASTRTPIPSLNQQAVIKGDSLVLAIAAASVLAKTARDKFMQAASRRFSLYGFAKHKGYGTAEHLASIKQYGTCPLHRLSFKGCS